jgi:hypothetical protein
MTRARPTVPLEFWVAAYLLLYLPNVMVTRWVTTTPHTALGRPLTGIETLPASLIISMVLTYLFIWLSGWYRDSSSIQVAGKRIPFPTRHTFISGIGTALILFTVPLSFTIRDVSIPFMQLLMRGDILLIAPVLDFMFGRRVRWWSWVALVMVLAALVLTLTDRGGFKLPPIAIATIILYTLGYFVRLAVMNRISKTGDPASVRRYFVEEKVIALPLSVLALAVLAVSGIGGPTDELYWGFVGVWTDPVIIDIFFIGLTLTVISVVSIIILLNPQENAYCVPLERAASLLAGVGGSVLLALYWGGEMPREAELIGAGILIAAIVLLSVAPRLSRPRPVLPQPTVEEPVA